ncbi:MAG: nucleotidyltransferase family protein [Pyrinomonadaceae bacterium]
MFAENKEQVFKQLSENRAVLKRLGVRRFGLFGSFLRKQQTRQSDIDLIVEFEDGKKSFDNFMHLAFFLEDLFGRKVDLMTPESLSPHIGPKILLEMEYAVTD